MNAVVEEGARAAATRLSDQYGADVPMRVEAELHRDPNASPGQYVVDPISLGALIVSIATLAWTIYQDLRKQNQPPPAPQVVARTVRIQLDHPSNLPQLEQAHIIDVTVEEVLRQAEES